MSAKQAGIPVIAVDAMGGDHGPGVVVSGAVEALRRDAGFRVALYGDADAVGAEVQALDANDLPLDVVACTQDIAMGEAPATAIRSRPDSPIVRAMRDHRAGDVDAVVSAGSTGAMVAASLILLGRLEGADRPAIATVIPTLDRPFVLLDVGANVQCTPEHLLDFARMGAVYGREVLSVDAPRVGLLNIGEEPGKGTELVVAAHGLLRESELDFAGNVESRGLLQGTADVVVTDGFTGNMVLKLIEGFGLFMARVAGGSDSGASGGGLRGLLERMDYTAYGGALLLGVKGSPVICHGASNARAITNAVSIAARLAARDLPALVAAGLAAGG